ncbi:MAG TPA: GNAT family N-acetyltransferase [Xanthobacteraceae bacterium]|nr:GNAT family N-acetyltransferase [Xanthobacteraceae bacterium]
MYLEVVDNLQRFTELRDDWESVYRADPDAHFFLSWTFMREWIGRLEGPWFILAAKRAAEANCEAFFPLRVRTKERQNGEFFNEINMAGNYFADYTGFICRPESAEQAIAHFAAHVRQLHWANLRLENVRASRERLAVFLRHFPEKKFKVVELERINQPENINNCICPAVRLPSDWDTFLNGNLGSETRRTIKRFMKRVEESDEFRITHANAETIERDLKILLQLWAAQWGGRKGERLQTILSSNFKMLSRCFAVGSLFLPVMWKGDTPVGAQATFVDPVKRTLHAYMGARDESFGKPSPGIVLHAHSIRYAIENGFTTYDFLRGNESYKYSFGAEEHRIACIVVSTHDGANLGVRLDPRSVPEVLQRAVKRHESGKLAEAERAYRQVLDVEPKNAQALYCFAQLMATKGNHAAAKRLFKALLAIKPDSCKIWIRLAQSLEARRQFAEAAQAYREIIKRQPDYFPAHRGLGLMLLKLRRHAEAVHAFESALALKPSDAASEQGLARAIEALGPVRTPGPLARNGHYNQERAGRSGPPRTWLN